MSGSTSFDVAVLGAGIGGYVAAIRSAQLGKKVVLIEKDKIGGTCLNCGCIPTKALLASVDILNSIKRSEEFGFHTGNITIDLARLMARKDSVVKRLIEGVDFLVRKNKIQLINGKGSLLSKNQIHIHKADGTDGIVSAQNIIVATGSVEYRPSYVEENETRVLTTREALEITEIPQSMVIIGGGLVGIEFALIFKSLGSNVRIFEEAPNILPSLDKDLNRTYLRILKKKDIEVYTSVKVKLIKTLPNSRLVTIARLRDAEISVETDRVLVTDSRKPVSEFLGLDKIGVEMKDGFVVVDAHMRTNVSNIFAVGDVTGGKMFAHTAIAEAIVAAETISGLESILDQTIVPTCMYCSPELASVGLSEDEAKLVGYNVTVGKFYLLANGGALALGETEGLAKVVCSSETGEILGVHLIGPHATEIIGEAGLAIKLECTSEEIGALMHSHPTISEALMEAARDVSKKTIQA